MKSLGRIPYNPFDAALLWACFVYGLYQIGWGLFTWSSLDVGLGLIVLLLGGIWQQVYERGKCWGDTKLKNPTNNTPSQ